MQGKLTVENSKELGNTKGRKVKFIIIVIITFFKRLLKLALHGLTLYDQIFDSYYDICF